MLSLLRTVVLIGASAASYSAFAASTTAIELPTTHVLTLAAAHVIADEATSDATLRGTPGVVAVVDAGGHLILLERMDGVGAASSDIAAAKARTAALFKAPTKKLESAINGGRPAAITAGLTMMNGGEPIVVDGQVIGAVGVSTATPPNDAPIAERASQALAGFAP
ncbi:MULTISPECIES: GlcG/HbpS family heme-binding protein [unclassified Paraburkholderia]|nr:MULTISPECIES: heme-binding protein [unclassified Paraburkholderia]MBN3853686.1 heme-binding protein [Paraburkholderia sp. Ac-20340]